MSIQKFAHTLKIKYGTSPYEPTTEQVIHICDYINKIRSSGRFPTEQDWVAAVRLYCPSAGQYQYHGIDNSDLNTLLALAIQIANNKA